MNQAYAPRGGATAARQGHSYVVIVPQCLGSPRAMWPSGKSLVESGARSRSSVVRASEPVCQVVRSMPSWIFFVSSGHLVGLLLTEWPKISILNRKGRASRPPPPNFSRRCGAPSEKRTRRGCGSAARVADLPAVRAPYVVGSWGFGCHTDRLHLLSEGSVLIPR